MTPELAERIRRAVGDTVDEAVKAAVAEERSKRAAAEAARDYWRTKADEHARSLEEATNRLRDTTAELERVKRRQSVLWGITIGSVAAALLGIGAGVLVAIFGPG